MKWVITLGAVFLVSCFSIAIAQYGIDANEKAIIGHESQQQAQEGMREAQQERMYGAMDANQPQGRMKRGEMMEQKYTEKYQQRMAELEKIKSLAQQENATKTMAALDTFMAGERQDYQQKMSKMEQWEKKAHKRMDANSTR